MNSQVGYLLGLAMEYIQKGNLESSERLLNQALKMAPKNSEIYRLLGVNFAFAKNLEKALKMFERAIKIEPNNWLAYSNQGNVLRDLKRFDLALKSYGKAIAMQPNYAEVYNNIANALMELGQFDTSIANYQKAIDLQPNYADAHHGKGNALKKMGSFTEAIDSYEMARKIDPSAGYMLASYISTKMQICEWDGIDVLIPKLHQLGKSSAKKVHPFHLLSICDDPRLLLELTQQYMYANHPMQLNHEPIEARKQSQKIRLGYFSPDFRNHAVSFLIAGMIEEHDRNKFELVAFSMGPSNKADDMSLRLQNSFDQYIDISDMSDEEAAKLGREMEIDIAIDLGGLTQDARPSIFAYRLAPIQIGYIGYLGTMGASYMDYIIADSTIIPIELQGAYCEKIIHLPSYQVNDPKRKIADKIFTKEELGLPQEGFIYCCFNNNYKITPSIVDSWSSILKSVNKSVIFLYAENRAVRKNLLSEFLLRGINSERIIFAEHLPREEYLARYRVADLFLDTSPYNAGTTASDALWAGLPVLTFLGQSFSARMGASILNAIGLPELVTSSQNEYEALAIELGLNPSKLLEIKNKLAKNRLTTPLFDTPLFTRNLEAAYTKAYTRFQNGLPPEHIY